MKKYRRQSTRFLLAVFTVMLLSSFYQSRDIQIEESEEITVIHAHEISGEAPGNTTRSLIEAATFDGRQFQVFIFQSIQHFHTLLTNTYYNQNHSKITGLKTSIQLYLLVQKFLI